MDITGEDRKGIKNSSHTFEKGRIALKRLNFCVQRFQLNHILISGGVK